jgi:tetratricopeptide (TPR) repeat protein
MFHPSLLKYGEFYQELLKGVADYRQLGNRLIRLGEQAHAFRRFDEIKEIGQLLSQIPVKHYQSIGCYFIAVAANSKGNGDQQEARKLFEIAANIAPSDYKAKAILSLAAVSFNSKDFEAAFYYYQETIKASPFTIASMQAARGMAVLKSIEGYHDQALEDLESLLPIAKYAQPHVYFDYLNSLAVELGEVGRKPEARMICKAILASPFTFAYPEWRETAEGLKQANRSSVTINLSQNIPHNVLLMPQAEPGGCPSPSELKPARVLNLQEWKKKILKKKVYDAEQKREEINGREMLMRIMHIYTRDETSNEKRRRMYGAVEKIASEQDEWQPEQ